MMLNLIENYGSIIISVFFIFLFVLIFKISSKPKKCSVCGTETRETFSDSSDKRIPMCRNHSVKRFKEDFLNSKFKMVVIEPDFVTYPWGYLYATISTLAKWQYPKEAQDKISNLLLSIEGKNCEVCKNISTIAYLNKEDYEFPWLEKISATPKYLCKNCTFNKIESTIQGAKEPLYEGLYAPTNDDGLYCVQEF